MKTITTELTTHLAGDVTTLATCWKLTLTDNTIMGFTDHDKSLIVNSATYEASTGFTPTSVSSGDNLAIDNLDVEGVLDSSSITEIDILAGKYDFAEIDIFQVNYKDLTQGTLNLRRGWLGKLSVENGFTAEVRGLTERLAKTIGQLYSPSCRAKLGDSKCTVNMTPYTKTGSVTSVTSNRVFVDTSRTEATGFFNFGKITFTSGNNNNLSMEVKEYDSAGNILLVLPMPYNIAVSDTYSIEAGCDKTFKTCRDTFSNAVNFRGEPHVPGTDNLLKTSTTK